MSSRYFQGRFPSDPICGKCGAVIRVCTHVACSKDQRELRDISNLSTDWRQGLPKELQQVNEAQHRPEHPAQGGA